MRARHSVLIVDDEPLARRRLRQLLSLAPDFVVVGECDDGSSVPAAVRALKPSVVFMDVRMIQTDGFAAEAAIRTMVRHVIFVTAFPEHAVRAFDVAAFDYLVKPLTEARFAATLDRIRKAAGGADHSRVLLGTPQGGSIVPLRDISWIEARRAYVVVHAAGEQYVLRDSLPAIVQRFGNQFLRIHRSAVVNLARMRALIRDPDLRLELDDGTRLPVSRRRATALIARLRAGR